MQLMRQAEVPAMVHDKVFRHSRSRALLGAFVLLTAAIGLVSFGWIKQIWLSYYVSGVIVICLLLFQKMITARFQPANWLVRLTDDGLFIKFRSYLNDHFPDQDLTVVLLSFAEIRSAKLVREHRQLPDRDEDGHATATTKHRTLVELEIASDCRQLKEELDKERSRVIAGRGTSATRYHDFPVRVLAPDRLQIDWGVVPSAQNFLDLLTRHTLVRPAEVSTKDFVDLAALSREEQQARLLELAESGDMIGAIAMARRLYSYDLATAKSFVEGLAGKNDRS